jgi:hypothetical protein
MDDQKKELSATIWTDTKKLAVWKEDISATIWNEWSKILDKNQIPISLDKREKELAKKRCSEN